MSSKSNSLNKETNECEKCDKRYTNVLDTKYKWCEVCNVIKNFTKWNKETDDLFQEGISTFDIKNDTVFERISFSDQFSNIEKTGKSNGLYSAIWKDGPLRYDDLKKEWRRESDKKVILSDYVFRDKVKMCSNFKIVYGITQRTKKGYSIVFHSYCEECSKHIHNTEYKWCGVCKIIKNFTDWTSGDEDIDELFREKHSMFDIKKDTVFEWISFSDFSNIEETSKSNGLYSAIWKDGLLRYDDLKKGWRRESIKVMLRYCRSRGEFLNVFKNHSNSETHGITQHPDNFYIIVFNIYCKECNNQYTDILDTGYKWCEMCKKEIKDFTNRTSRDDKINTLFQDKLSKFKFSCFYDPVFEWISFPDQFSDVEEVGNCFYSAIWKDGPLHYDDLKKEWRRESVKVMLRHCSCDELLNVVEKYPSFEIFGISQISQDSYYIVSKDIFCEKCHNLYVDVLDTEYKCCKECRIVKNFKNWTSGNENIDGFIKRKHSKFSVRYNTVFEWIPYDQFKDIKELEKDGSDMVYSATWKDGPLFNHLSPREPNQKVTLKCSYNSQNAVNEFLNEVKEYLNYEIFGISQKPDTKEYIIVLYDGYYCKKCHKPYADLKYKWCKPCHLTIYLDRNSINWASGDASVDIFIKETQLLKANKYFFEWISFDQFNNIKEIYVSNDIRSANWKDGPLYYDYDKKKWIRESNKEVALKCSQSSTNEFLNEVKAYLIKPYNNENVLKIYGISRNPDAKNYIMVFQNGYCERCGEKYTNMISKWCRPCQTSGNEKIDDLIQERYLEIDSRSDVVFEWIPYNQFDSVKEISEDNFTTVSLVKWRDGPLHYDYDKKEWTRMPNKEVALRSSTDEFLNEVKSYSIKEYNYNNILKIYGISQNPESKDYTIVLHDVFCEECGKQCIGVDFKWCEPCMKKCLGKNFEDESIKPIMEIGIEKIDNFIQRTQAVGVGEYIFEWIPPDQFNDIKITGKDESATVFSAVWEKGPLFHDNYKEEWTREPNKPVVLKCFHNSNNITDEFLVKIIKAYSNIDRTDDDFERKNVHGMSQDQITKDYIIVLQEKYYCTRCGEKYIDADTRHRWCKLCHSNYLKNIIITSENKTIDDFIKEMLSKIYSLNDIVFEWIPYSQFNNIEKIGEGGFSTVYSAIWEDGPLRYDDTNQSWFRKPDMKVALKNLHNTQNINEILKKKVSNIHSMKFPDIFSILSIYGISQNPDTKDYIMILEYAKDGNLNNWMTANCEDFTWKCNILCMITGCLKVIHQKQMVHCNLHTGNVLAKSMKTKWKHLCISDMGLCGEIGNTDEKNIYGVMPYVAPEVLRGKPYTQAADIYSLGMIMYFIATGRQPFADRAHDQNLALSICNGVRPEINEMEVPKCYIDLMKRCWDSNPDNRPSIYDIHETVELFCGHKHATRKRQIHYVIEEEFKKAEEYRKANLSSIESDQSTTHPQAIYTSRLLNPFTKDLPNYDSKQKSQKDMIDDMKNEKEY